ncbi:hypothetical protein LIER_27830 [Lithospermum erythrorhizon]|uniref:Reverse transcriptase n=1 Tax=Lithospermum erythrorhizon TaxID=34254 RepID=A0AAV3RH17_LITER
MTRENSPRNFRTKACKMRNRMEEKNSREIGEGVRPSWEEKEEDDNDDKGAHQKLLNGIKIARDRPSINHILFANDTMIFCRAKVEEGQELMAIHRDYETASGQKINVGKSFVCLDPEVQGMRRRSIASVLGMREVQDQGKYLGLPSYIGRTKKEVFKYLVAKVEDRIKGWKGKLLSQEGPEVMIKSVASAIPNFVMNCFKLPVGIIDALNSLMAKIFWANSDKVRGIHWKSWDMLCKEKLEGDLAKLGTNPSFG